MTATDFIKKAVQNGLEYFGMYYGMYRATVADNNDPEYLGRLKVKVPQIYSDVPEKWVFPRGVIGGKKGGQNWLPSVGDHIWITFENGNPKYPIWEYGWWTKDTLPERAKRNPQDSYLFYTPNGNYIELNDEKDYVRIENKKGFVTEINQKGVYIGSSSKNLFDVLDKLIKAAENTKTSTNLGPQPFINVAEWSAVKTEFENFLTNEKDGD